jgi:succinoglycan biosynthesis protein ExoU
LSIAARPGICVIIAAYNASATIQRAVKSALDQPEVTEVIVVDDASTDDTVMIAQHQDDGAGRLRIVRLETNGGPAAARNRALALSQAEFVTPLDADDYILPGRLEKLLANVGDADFLADDLFRQFENEAEISPINLIKSEDHSSTELTLSYFVGRNISRTGENRRELGFLKPLMRRSFLDKHGLRYEEQMRLGEDYALYASALAKGASFRLAPGYGYVAVHRDSSLSSSHTKQDLERLYEFDRLLLKRFELSAEERRVVTQHAKSIRLKIDHRQILDDKGDKRYLDMFMRLLRSPSTALYVLKQTGLDKLGR